MDKYFCIITFNPSINGHNFPIEKNILHVCIVEAHEDNIEDTVNYIGEGVSISLNEIYNRIFDELKVNCHNDEDGGETAATHMTNNLLDRICNVAIPITLDEYNQIDIADIKSLLKLFYTRIQTLAAQLTITDISGDHPIRSINCILYLVDINNASPNIDLDNKDLQYNLISTLIGGASSRFINEYYIDLWKKNQCKLYVSVSHIAVNCNKPDISSEDLDKDELVELSRDVLLSLQSQRSYYTQGRSFPLYVDGRKIYFISPYHSMRR